MNWRDEERFQKIRNILLDLSISMGCEMDEAIEADDDDKVVAVDDAMERLYDVMDAVDKAMEAFEGVTK